MDNVNFVLWHNKRDGTFPWDVCMGGLSYTNLLMVVARFVDKEDAEQFILAKASGRKITRPEHIMPMTALEGSD